MEIVRLMFWRMVEPRSGPVDKWAIISFRLLGGLYLAIGLWGVLLAMLGGSIVNISRGLSFCEIVSMSFRQIRWWLWANLGPLGFLLAVVAAGVGIQVCCKKMPMDLNGLAQLAGVSLLPILYVIAYAVRTSL